MTKEGFYDWIASFEELEALLPVAEIEQGSSLNTLIIGGGTALFSEKLAAKFGSFHARILSTDNDKACIDHMKWKFPDSKVEYLHHDIIEDAGTLPNGDSYDFVFDKGTFDAIHVEGSVAALLIEVNRLLKVGGLYVLITINSKPLITQLFALEGLGFSIRSITEIPNSVNCHIVIITKTGSCQLALPDLIRQEKDLTNNLFRSYDKTLLSKEKIASIHSAFEEQVGKDGHLEWKEAHKLLFPPEENFGYDYELFLGDVQEFPVSKPGFMTAEEAIEFIRTME